MWSNEEKITVQECASSASLLRKMDRKDDESGSVPSADF
jgi:hypothetical protein